MRREDKEIDIKTCKKHVQWNRAGTGAGTGTFTVSLECCYDLAANSNAIPVHWNVFSYIFSIGLWITFTPFVAVRTLVLCIWYFVLCTIYNVHVKECRVTQNLELCV